MFTSNTVAALLFVCGCSAAYNFTEFKARGTPNETRSITLGFFPDDPDLSSTDWTWRNLEPSFLFLRTRPQN